ncbi:RNA helicase, putative [Plasmodium vinckei brucechwatti]|uniref:RNA helicase, putative n=1 Tax=Plasmodium vinckei brucechwatti TaxID=119398 RepID=A0A6V7S633_PLAVN|nr:RNA helicase, putative [Plasmodium vinckei brucechwatti]
MMKNWYFRQIINQQNVTLCKNLKSSLFKTKVLRNISIVRRVRKRNIQANINVDGNFEINNGREEQDFEKGGIKNTNKSILREKREKIKDELYKNSFLDYNFKINIYLKLNELKIYNPTEIQKNVIPLLLQGKEEKELTKNKNEMHVMPSQSLYKSILKNRAYINNYLKSNSYMNTDFYDLEKYKCVNAYEDDRQTNNKYDKCEHNEINATKDSKNAAKCFNDIYVIVSPDNSGKTLSYFLPIIDNFYRNNENIMTNLSNFYNFLNKYNYKKYRNKLFRKKEKLRYLKNKENLFFNISYEKFKIKNRYIYMRRYNNFNASNSYINNKKNNKLNSLKHKKNISFPYAIILTNTREAACELFSFLKCFDINIELLAGGYGNKKKSIKKFHVQSFHSNKKETTHFCDNDDMPNKNSDSCFNTESQFISSNNFLKNIKSNSQKKKDVVNYNIDILIGTPDKIFEKLDNAKNKHLYNLKFLKYLVVEESETLCNPFNEKKLQLIFNHVKNYTNMYYFKRPALLNQDGVDNDTEHEEKKETQKLDDEEKTDKMNTRKRSNNTIKELNKKYASITEEANENGQDDESEIEDEKKNSSIISNEEIDNSRDETKSVKTINKNENIIKKIESIENVKNTISSNIPITIFVSATKTFCISEFLSNNIRSKYVQQIINLNSHDIRSEIKHVFINSKSKEKVSLLLEMLSNKELKRKEGNNNSQRSENKGVKGNSHIFLNKYVIFCNTRKSVMNLKDILSELKYKVSYIHNEMNYKDRSQNYRDFKKSKTNILICTNILSRGVQFENCEIINYDIGNNINDYIYKSSKVNLNKFNNTSNSLTSFFNKKNTSLVNDIIEKTVDKKQIVFQNLNKKVSKMLNIHNKYYDIIKKKKKYQKRGGRKALNMAPRRNCLSKKNKILSKKLYFYHKMGIERKRLIKKGILKSHEKIPRYPNRKADIYDSNEYNTVTKLEDGSLQILRKKRKSKKHTNDEQGSYDQETIVLDSMPTYEDEAKIKEKKHQKKTYF